MEEQNKPIDEKALENAAIELENNRLKEKYEKLLTNSPDENDSVNLSSDLDLAQKESLNTRIKTMIIGLGILLMLAFAGYKYINGKESMTEMSRIHIAELDFYSNPGEVSRGLSAGDLSNISQAQKLLKEEKIYEAIGIFEEIEVDQLPSANKLTLAQAYLKVGAFDKARNVLDSLLVDQTNMGQEIKWLQILNLIQMGEVEKAKPIMEMIVNNKNYKWKEVQALLQTLTN